MSALQVGSAGDVQVVTSARSWRQLPWAQRCDELRSRTKTSRRRPDRTACALRDDRSRLRRQTAVAAIEATKEDSKVRMRKARDPQTTRVDRVRRHAIARARLPSTESCAGPIAANEAAQSLLE